MASPMSADGRPRLAQTTCGTGQAKHDYQYGILPRSSCIRLLSGIHKDASGVISCRMHEVDIEASAPIQPAYHCLSYTWGDPFGTGSGLGEHPNPDPIWSRTRQIHVSGPGAESGALTIKKNLHDFLEELERRDVKGATHFWIDAICIHQDNLDERAAQVGIMGDIYRSCESVIIWFGIQDADTTPAFSIMSSLSLSEDEFISRVRSCATGGMASVVFSQLISELDLPLLSAEDLLACARFLQRTWLSRVWTVQEVILPKEASLWCGSFDTPMIRLDFLMELIAYAMENDFHPILKLVMKAGDDLDQSVSLYNRILVVRSIRQGFRYRHMPPNWNDCRSLLCSDHRDKLYGTLGLHNHIVITVDYTKPLHDIYHEFALKRGGNVHEDWEDPSARVVPGLPSWVPDYQVPLSPTQWELRAGFKYRAGTSVNSETFEQLLSPNPAVLALAGFCEDVVSAVGISYNELVSGTGLLPLLRSLELLLDPDLSTGDSAGPDVVQRFWRTLIANLPGNNPNPPKSEVVGPSFRALVRFLVAARLSIADKPNDLQERVLSVLEELKAASGSTHLPDRSEILELSAMLRRGSPVVVAELSGVRNEMRTYLASLDRMFHERRFFITENGRMGIGSQTVLPGDTIFIVKGLRYPVLLRAVGNSRYTRVGKAYVDGIMFGEALGSGEFGRVEIE